MGKRYELVCEEARLYCVVGYGGRCSVDLIVDDDQDQNNLVEFLNRTNGKSLKMLVTEYGGGYDLGCDDISDVLEDERWSKERKLDE